MMAWIDQGRKPTIVTLAAECEAARVPYGEACHFDPAFTPKPLSSRIYPRVKPTPKP
jgi:hypothetical protein